MHRLLQDMAQIRSGYSFRGRIEPMPHGKYRVVQIKDVGAGARLAMQDLIRTEVAGVKAHHFLRPGEVLFAARALQRWARVIETALPNTIFGSQFFVCKPHAGLAPAYLAWYLNQPPAQRYFEENAAGTNVRIITKEALGRLPVVVPPLPKQHLIAHLYQLSQREQELVTTIQVKRRQLLEATLLASLQTDTRTGVT